MGRAAAPEVCPPWRRPGGCRGVVVVWVSAAAAGLLSSARPPLGRQARLETGLAWTCLSESRGEDGDRGGGGERRSGSRLCVMSGTALCMRS